LIDELLCTDSQDILEKLEPIRMDTSRRTECLPDTRAKVLKFIIDWVNDSASEENILWIHGPAGCSKSTLSTAIANMLSDSRQLGAFLFFDHDIIERGDPTTVVRTLAHQLGVSQPRIGVATRAVIEKNQNMLISPFIVSFRSSLSTHFQKLKLIPQ
jgi:hypothetical protein